MYGTHLEPGMTVFISENALATKKTHGLVHPRKIRMLGTVQVITRIRDAMTIVIDDWHWHPYDLQLGTEPEEIEKKEFNPVFFNIEDIL